jgi:RNA polymerase sigma factor (sigma-70 family)
MNNERNERELALKSYLSNPNAVTRNALIMKNQGIIKYVVNSRLRIPKDLRWEAFQEGVIGMCRAIENYDSEKGAFFPHAVSWVHSTVGQWLQHEIRADRCVTINTIRKSNYKVEAASREEPDVLTSSAPSPDECADIQINKQRLAKALSELSLSERERAIIDAHFYKEVHLQELASTFGVSRQRIEQIKKRLLRRIAQKLGGAK